MLLLYYIFMIYLLYIYNVHPCLSSSKPFFLEIIWLLKVCCQTGRWLIGGQCFLHKSGNVSLLPGTPSERRKLTLKVSSGFCACSRPVCAHPHIQTSCTHIHKNNNDFKYIDRFTNIWNFFSGRFVKLTPNLILTSLISTFNFSSLKFPETQSVTLSFRINLSQPGINWEKYFNGRIVWIKLTCGQVPEKPIWLLIGASELAVSSAFHSSGDPKCVRQDRARWRHGGRPHGCLFLSTPVHGCSVTSCLEFLLWQTAAWHSSRINAFPHKLLFCWDVLSQQQKIEPGHRLSSVLVHIMSVPVSAVFGKF